MAGSLHMESTSSQVEKIPKSSSEQEKRQFKFNTCKIDGENVCVAKGVHIYANTSLRVCIPIMQMYKKKVREYDQEIPYSHTTDQPTAP